MLLPLVVTCHEVNHIHTFFFLFLLLFTFLYYVVILCSYEDSILVVPYTNPTYLSLKSDLKSIKKKKKLKSSLFLFFFF